MSERRGRGHRKLWLCSNKYYEKKKYFPKSLLVSIPKRTVSILSVSIPIELVAFRASLPLAAYSGSPVSLLKVLIDRIIHLRALTEGKHKQLMIYNCSTCKHRMEAFIGKGNSMFLQTNRFRSRPSCWIIKSDYSWTVSYRNEGVSIEHCTMLKKIPLHINSGKHISFV